MIDDTIPLRKGFHHFFFRGGFVDWFTFDSKFLEFLISSIVFKDLNHRWRRGSARNNLKSGKNCRKRGNIDLSTFENYLKMLEDETSIRSRREICCFFELLNNSSIQTTRPFFEIVMNIAFVNFLSTIPRRRPPVSSLASNRRKKMSVALEAGLRHPKHNICLNNISKLACSFERLQHFRHESLSVWFDSRNHGWRGGFYRRISLERKRREDPRISRQTFRRSRGTMEDEIYDEGVLEKELATSQNFLDSPNEGIKKKFLVTPFYILSNV